MSELLSALEGFRSEALAEQPDARIEEDFAELQRSSEVIERRSGCVAWPTPPRGVPS